MSPSGDQIFEFNPASLLAAFKEMQKGMADVEKGVVGGSDRMDKAMEKFGRTVGVITSRSEQAQNRYIKSIENTAAAYGKTGVEKLMAQRDQIIRRLGNEEDAVKRVTAAYAKMIQVEQNRKPGGGEGGQGSGMLAMRGLRDLFEGRTAYGEVQIGKSIAGLSGAAAIIGGATAAFVGLAAASLSSAESLAKYGVEVKDVELRTGLSAREVAQFTFAAKAVGQDVSITERIMRGLSTAMEDMSPSGAKARKTLTELGVSVYDSNGTLRTTADVLLQVSDAFSKLPPGANLSKDAMDLFKRVGVEAIPFLKELRENTRYFEDHNLPSPKQSQIDEWSGYNRQLSEFTANWEFFKRSTIAPLGQGFMEFINFIINPTPGKKFISNALPPRPTNAQSILGSVTDFLGVGGGLDEKGNANRLAQSLRSSGTLDGAQSELAKMKTAMDEARTKAQQMADSQGITKSVLDAQMKAVNETTAAYEHQKDVVKQIEKSQTNRLAVEEAIRKSVIDSAERAAHPYGMLPAERSILEFSKLPGVTASEIQAERGRRAPQMNEEVSDILRKAGLMVGPGGQIMRDQRRIGAAGGGLMDMDGDLTAKGEAQLKALGHMMEERLKVSDKDDRGWVDAAEKLLSTTNKSNRDAAIGGVKLRSMYGRDTAENRMATEREIAEIKIKSAGDEYRLGEARAAGDKNEALILKNLRVQYAAEVNAAEMEFAEQRAEEFRKQVGEIKSKAEGLFHTLFTNPKGFGSQLGTTLRDAALRPIESRLADSTARFLQPMIFGGGSNRPVAVDGSGAALVRVVNLGGGGTGFGGYGGGGSTFSGGSFSSGDFSAAGGGFSPAVFGANGISGGPGGTGGFAGAVGGGSTGGRFGGFHLPSLGSLKDAFWNENINHLGGGTTAASSMGGFGKLAGVLSSKGAGQIELGVGLPLAMAGLTGGRRGTAGGIFEGTLGGALTGAGIGTMFLPGIGTAIGAGIGAVAGFGIGVGEKIFGVESPINEAKRLAKSIYHVTIDSKIAQQIASAAQSYGGSIATAIRSPEIRNMLMLYSQATGQGNMLSSLVPRAGILQESGGQLSQMASFSNGTPYAYQSSLPIAGGYAANVWSGGSSNPLPGGLQINIGGAGAAQFMAGQIVTPENIQAGVSNAYQSSNNRVPTSALLSSPGLITG